MYPIGDVRLSMCQRQLVLLRNSPGLHGLLKTSTRQNRCCQEAQANVDNDDDEGVLGAPPPILSLSARRSPAPAAFTVCNRNIADVFKVDLSGKFTLRLFVWIKKKKKKKVMMCETHYSALLCRKRLDDCRRQRLTLLCHNYCSSSPWMETGEY